MKDSCVIFLTCGRKEYFYEAEKSWKNFIDKSEKKYIIDDSANKEYREWLYKNYSNDYEILFVDPDKNIGHTGAMQFVFKTAFESKKEYCVFIEEDWVLLKEPDLNFCKKIINENNLCGMGFLREPWTSLEKKYGDFEKKLIKVNPESIVSIEKNFFTYYYTFLLNPSIFVTRLYSIEKWEGQARIAESSYMEKLKKHNMPAGCLKGDFYVRHIGFESAIPFEDGSLDWNNKV